MKHKVLAAVTAGVATVASMALVAPPADAAPFHGALAGSLTPATSVSSTTAAPAADPKSLAVAAADRAVASGLDELRAGPDESYERVGVTTGPGGMQYVSYERTYRGLPVIGGDAVVVTDASGRVRDTTAASGPSPRNISLVAKITAEQATQTAKARLSRVDDVGAPRLVVLAWGGKPKLAWEAVVAGVAKNKPSIQHVFVDARTGAVADHYDEVVAGSGNAHFAGQVTIDTSRVGSSYSMTDAGRPGIQCGGQNGSAYTKSTDTWGNGSGTDLETACVDVMYTAAQEWNMLRDWLGRNGIDGSGRGFGARVGMTDVNAYWTGTYTTFGRNQAGNKQLTSIDVVAHEYGHAIFQTTPGGAGSQSDNERGGLNESTGDIFGAITEAYASNPKEPLDYTVGQEVNLAGNGPIRYMYNPSKVGDPNCYSSSIPSTEVHAAAGPQNHWFYLLAEGSNPTNGQPTSPTCNSSTVTGIGIQKAGKIFMGALSRKSSTWKHSSVRSASVAAAVELFGANSAECASTKAAWSAVSVAAQSGEPTCTDPGPGSADFSLSLNPSSGSVQPGGQATATVGTQTTVGSAQTVNLTASGLPSGATASFTPSSVTSGGSATLTVSTTSATPTGTYQITVTGTGTGTGTPRHTATYTLTVGGGSGGTEPPDISVANVKAHLQQFQTIATGNGGNRRSTGAGYTQSVSYLEQKLTAAGYTVTRQNCTSGCTAGAGPNLIADWPGGDTNQVIMAGAHLDGVAAGPGINDNGSGSGMLLEVALTLAAQKPSMAKHVRFGWWTDEEQGLNGSKFYVNSLSSTERSKIKAYLNYDMIGSTNAGYFINNITTATAANLKAYYDKLNLQPEENVEGQGRSDDASFKNAGIPTSGLAAGASATKTSAQAAKWGGTAGRAYDSCYHAACDTVSNVNDTVLGRAAGATAYALWKAAVGGDTPPPTRDFSLSLNPSSGSVQPGQQATATVTTATTSGTAQTVSLSATVTPAGPTVSVTPTQVTSGGSATLTVSTSASTPAGTYSVTVTGGGETATRTATFTLVVNGSTGGDRTFPSTTVYSIPDNGYAFSPIQSTATGQASSPVQVALTVEHPCSETLSVYLMAPGSSDFITIKDQEFSTTCTPWSGSRTYQVPVSSTASGAWYLLVMDGSQDSRTGKLTGWSITL